MILVTGCAGFIGFHLVNDLLSKKHKVIGIDNINSYYEKNLKIDRINILKKFKNFIFIKKDLSNFEELKKSLKRLKFNFIIHLAAQPGVRFSLKNPHVTLSNNLVSFINILEIARIRRIKKFIYASSSSVYGEAKIFPFTENDKNIDPISIYGASKLSNEILAKSYSRNFSLVCVGLRFFTVYGPFGRPDMAYFKFAKLNREKKVVDIYNKGQMFRDFTYITDIISAINKVIKIKIKKKNLILNIGKGRPNKLIELIKLLEKYQKIKIKKNYVNDIPKGDIKKTFSNNNKIRKLIKWEPNISLKDGVKKFIYWFDEYYKSY
jgi:UDP-glucuronate 4-epimerase